MLIRIITALVTLVVGVTLAGAYQATVKTVPPKSTDPTSGKAMFMEYCAACHGETGVGNGPAASAMKKAPADLTQLSAHNGGKFPEAKISRFIKGDDAVAAHGSRDMPVWGDVFKSMTTDPNVVTMRVYNLTAYVKTLQK
jgi:mono/diheme cytochrome c family protein